MNNKKWIMAGIAESRWNGTWDWKTKIDDDNLHFKEKMAQKNPWKCSTLCKNMLRLAIDILKSQRFATAVITNKTKRQLVDTCYIIRLAGPTK